MLCVSHLPVDVSHYFEPSCVSVVFSFCVLMKTSDDAPQSPIFSDARRPPPSVTSESRDAESGSVTPASRSLG